ncbi:MAG: hypothetical protein KUG73_11380 [Pseudomonadales bacterium]|nr:hypothetical protein [Pseudomonadales bacterium]
MNTYEFEIIFKLDKGENPEKHLDVLFEAGCDDAVPGVGLLGSISLSFSREGISAIEAVKSALLDVKKAIPHSYPDKASPYLMNLSDLAHEFNFTKQNMSKYSRGVSTLGEIPTPQVAGKTSYWFVAQVAEWLNDGGVIGLSEEQRDLYLTIWTLNAAIEKVKNPKTNDEFFELIKSA